MENKRRAHIWISIALAYIMCLSNHVFVFAIENTEISSNEEVRKQNIEEDEQIKQIDKILISEDEAEIEIDHKENSVFDKETSDILSDNEEKKDFSSISYNDNKNENVSSVSSDNVMSEEIQEITSDNNMPEIILSENRPTVSDDQFISEDIPKNSVDVAFPAKISFNMLFVGDERKNGNINSNSYCIENRGYTDVSILVQSVCNGFNEEEYVFSNISVREQLAEKGKKNVYIYIKWEKEQKDGASQTVLGDIFSPSKKVVILKAPKRNDDGKIIGENPESKIYFSFEGDLKSDTNEIWKHNELNVDLKFSIEAMLSTNTINEQEKIDFFENESSGATDSMNNTFDISDHLTISDNNHVLDGVEENTLDDEKE